MVISSMRHNKNKYTLQFKKYGDEKIKHVMYHYDILATFPLILSQKI